VGSSHGGNWKGNAASVARTPQPASSTPTAAPTRPRTTLSTKSGRATRQRLAPRAVRTAISRTRPTPAPSIRFATFAHATQSTSITAPSITTIISRISGGVSASRSVSARSDHPRFAVGCSAARRAPRARTSASAWATVAPGPSRATTR
jgi:hypothetical protein